MIHQLIHIHICKQNHELFYNEKRTNNNNNAKKRAAVKNVKHKRKIRRLSNWEAGQDGATLNEKK